jgi:ATP-dependent Clp protease protease subunit
MTHTDPAFDLDVLLLRERIVVIAAVLDAEAAARVIARLLYLDAVEPGEDIWLYVSGPGGEAAAGLAVADTVQALRSDVHTVAVGDLVGTAVLVAAAGSPGKRHALPSARLTWRPPGDRAAELAAALGRPVPTGRALAAAEAIELGLVDALWRKPARQEAAA